jgi:nucleotidyltransferase substrate binding protein (TIGR01987 family)
MKTHNFAKAVGRLREAVDLPESNPLKVEVCVKRFEFTYETAKKTLAFILREKDIIASNPKEVIREAIKNGLITSIDIWDNMRDDRNDTSHEYDEEKAHKIYQRIESYCNEFEYVLNKMRV